MRCLGEHSRRTGARSDRFFCRIVFQIGDVIEVKLWDSVKHKLVFTRTLVRSSIGSSEDFPGFPSNGYRIGREAPAFAPAWSVAISVALIESGISRRVALTKI
jgi:hypothetical protein